MGEVHESPLDPSQQSGQAATVSADSRRNPEDTLLAIQRPSLQHLDCRCRIYPTCTHDGWTFSACDRHGRRESSGAAANVLEPAARMTRFSSFTLEADVPAGPVGGALEEVGGERQSGIDGRQHAAAGEAGQPAGQDRPLRSLEAFQLEAAIDEDGAFRILLARAERGLATRSGLVRGGQAGAASRLRVHSTVIRSVGPHDGTLRLVDVNDGHFEATPRQRDHDERKNMGDAQDCRQFPFPQKSYCSPTPARNRSTGMSSGGRTRTMSSPVAGSRAPLEVPLWVGPMAYGPFSAKP